MSEKKKAFHEDPANRFTADLNTFDITGDSGHGADFHKLIEAADKRRSGRVNDSSEGDAPPAPPERASAAPEGGGPAGVDDEDDHAERPGRRRAE